MWHTANDNAVPVQNSIMFASEMAKYKIPFELHIFRDGRHGLGLAPEKSRRCRMDIALQKHFLKKYGLGIIHKTTLLFNIM
ncbi:MAG: S9 family peptidase [Clostridiales bacterium]|nr:MAG: S9 family peptidase [Clostridiales bacterium]